MAGSQLAAAVRDGLEERDPDISIRRVKEAVLRGLLAIDGTPKVHTTEYFNHTFAPDFILSWPGGQVATRPVYLKFADDLDYLADEVKLVAEQHPMIIELDTEPSRHATIPEVAKRRLHEVAQNGDTLITDPDGLTELESEQRDRPILRLLGRALLQGGRGIVDDRTAAQTGRDLARGIAAAQRLEAEPTRRASEMLETILGGASHSRIQRFLQALWVGSGGSESTFPGKAALSGTLDDDALAFLIETEGVAESTDFWRRIGSNLTVDQLSRLPVAFTFYPNLQYLVEANIDRLWGRIIKVLNHGGQVSLESAGDSGPWWAVRDNTLCLMGETYEAFVGTLNSQLDHLTIISEEPHLEDLINRAKHNNIRLGELVLKSGNRFISYGSENNEDVSGDENLISLSSSLGSSALVTTAVASLYDGKNLKIQFGRATASTESSGKAPLRELVITAVPLLRDYQSAADARLRDIIPNEPGDPTLF